MKELRELRKRRRASAFLNGLGVGRKVAAIEPTHSTASHLESIMQAAEATAYGPFETVPPPPPDTDTHPEHPQDPSQLGNKEAAA